MSSLLPPANSLRCAGGPMKQKKNVSRPGSWEILEGDWGGQIYCSIPRAFLGTPETLRRLCRMIDAVEWPCNKGLGWDVYPTWERSIIGGMGGGSCLSGKIWVHPDLDQRAIAFIHRLFPGKEITRK